MQSGQTGGARVRIDKWLWAARFFKTRALAAEALQRGQVLHAGQPLKASREVRIGELLTVWQARLPRTVVVLGLSDQRGPATQAQLLYRETEDSLRQRAQMAERQRLAPEPMAPGARPTKRTRRELQAWDARWSAGVDPE